MYEGQNILYATLEIPEGEVLARATSPYAYAPDAPELAELRADLPELAERVGHPGVSAAYPPLVQLQNYLAVRATHALGAPWTFGIEPGISHGSSEGFQRANEVMIPWVSAVFQLRLRPGDGSLRPVNERAGWLADLRTGAVYPQASYTGVRQEANWLPDEATALGWRIVTGFVR